MTFKTLNPFAVGILKQEIKKEMYSQFCMSSECIRFQNLSFALMISHSLLGHAQMKVELPSPCERKSPDFEKNCEKILLFSLGASLLTEFE